MTKVLAYLCFAVFFLSACAHQNSKKSKDVSLGKLNRQTRVREQVEEQNRLQKLMVKEREALKAQKTSSYKIPKPETDENLYALVLKAYRESDFDELDFYVDRMSRRFSKSLFTDNALYLRGQLNLSMAQPAEALRDFEEILKTQTTGNKRASALLGKSIAYRKLQLYPYAEKALTELKQTYPGSPEFYKAELEERILKSERK